MLGLFLLGLISRKARNPHAIISVVVGALLILWLSLSKTGLWPDRISGWANPLHSFMTIILGTSSIVLLGALVGHFADKRTGSSERREDQNVK